MNDTGILTSCLTFLLVSEFFIAGLGGATSQLSLPANANFIDGPNSNTTAGDNPTGVDSLFCFAKFVFFGPFFDHCNILTVFSTVPVIGDIAAFLQGVVDFLHGLWQFFKQFVAYQAEALPFWLNLLIIVPPSVTLLFIGYRSIRSGSG